MEETKKCKECSEVKTLNEFYKCNSCNKGVMTICSDCYKQKYKNKNSIPGRTRAHSDKEEAERLLTAMGYELYNDDNPIHKQFLRRIENKYNGLD